MADVLIADDEPLARSRLKRMVEAEAGYSVCGEAENGRQALEQTVALQPDIVLMDIRMPGMDGMEAARQISQANSAPALIFCTAYEDYAIEAFDVHAVGYLVKPVRKEALSRALAKCGRLNRVQKKTLETEENSPLSHEYFLARTVKGETLIDLSRIQYFQADQKYLTAIHDTGETLCDGTLKEIEQRYGDRFLRIHRATLVNASWVEALDKTPDGSHWLRLKGGDKKLLVSRRHVSTIKNWLVERSGR